MSTLFVQLQTNFSGIRFEPQYWSSVTNSNQMQFVTELTFLLSGLLFQAFTIGIVCNRSRPVSEDAKNADILYQNVDLAQDVAVTS